MKTTFFLLAMIALLSCKEAKNKHPDSFEDTKKSHTKQPIANGTYLFTLQFAEWMTREHDVPCNLTIEDFKVRIEQNDKTNLPGNKILHEGMLMQHISGKWIVSDKEEDKEASEIGGCTGIIVVDFDGRIIVWC